MWFKVDDQLHTHRKARLVRRSHRTKTRDVAPFGLWVLAGSWSSDGFVPIEILEDWDTDAVALARRLVDAGLWWATEQDGEPGYGFHDWEDYLPRPDGINDASESGRRGNHVRWHEGRGRTDDACEFCAPDRGDIGAIDRGDDRPESGPHREPVPSRPDPTRPDTPSRERSATEDSARFEDFWEAYGKKVDRRAAEQKWRLALKKPGVTADLLIAAASAYVLHERTNNEAGRYIMGPAKWLLNERWRDERAGRVAPPRTRVQEHLELVRQMEAEEQGGAPRAIGGGLQ